MRHTDPMPAPLPATGAGTLREHVLALWQSLTYRIALLLTALFSFGFFITHYAVGIDDLSGAFYTSGELLAQGRFTWTLLGRFLKLYEHYPVFDAALAVCLMLLLLTLICALLRMATANAVSIGACTAFSCLYLSYPLACESYGYASLPLYINIGGLLCFGALYALYGTHGRWKPLAMALACALLVLVCSLYESVVLIYVFLVFALLLMQMRHGTARFHNLGGFLLEGLRYALPLALAFVVEAILSNWLIGVLHLTRSQNGANSIVWAAGYIRVCLTNIATGFLYNVCIKSLVYLPMGVLCAAMGVMLAFGIADGVRRKPRLPVILCYCGLFLTLILLSLVQGVDTPYRTAQAYPLFVAFAGLLLVQFLERFTGRRARMLVVCGMALLVFFQANDLNRWFAVDYQRYEKERAAVVQMAYDIRRADEGQGRPVVFVGNYPSDSGTLEQTTVTDAGMTQTVNTLRGMIGLAPLQTVAITETAVQSYLRWATTAFGDNRALHAFFDYCGFHFAQGTAHMLREARRNQPTMAVWPEEGSVQAMSDCIAVNLGK